MNATQLSASVSPLVRATPVTRAEWFGALALAVGLTMLFWGELWAGYGLIGGDLYTYFFPQKTYFVEALAEGDWPLWNPLVGHGYPFLAESQVGMFYPPHILAYGAAALGWCDVNCAYNLVQLAHYLLAFVGAWLYLREIGCAQTASLLGGLVYTYAWFPPRLCLEWAIIGGAWFPWAIFCAERFLRTGYWRYPLILAILLGNQMLAGHFNLAFITQFVLVTYVLARLWWTSHDLPPQRLQRRWLMLGQFGGVLMLGFALAAVQLVPTFELKQRSQRTEINRAFDPGYGYIPLWYWKTWARLIAPGMWPEHELHLQEAPRLLASGTNKVEAHLYFGTATLGVLLFAWGRRRLASRRDTNTPRPASPASPTPLFPRQDRIWYLLGLFALVYSSGALLFLARYVPGFAFFAGPGRWSLVTAWMIAVLVARSWHDLSLGWRRTPHLLLATSLFIVSIYDLSWVGRVSGYVYLVPSPPVNHVHESAVRKLLLAHPASSGPPRLFCRGPNLPTILGIASTPPYLGIGPAEYYRPDTVLPGELPLDHPATPPQIDWLQRAGVTHILSFAPLDLQAWPVTLIWEGYDRFLNAAWGRREPFFLYQLQGTRGRASWLQEPSSPPPHIREYRSNRITLETDHPREDTLILSDLAYSGWVVTIDDQPAPTLVIDQMYRGVTVPAGPHRITWSYRPRSVLVGSIVSACALVFVLTLGHIRYWHPHWLTRSAPR